MSQTKTITTYKVSAFDSKAAAEGGLCVMVASTYTLPQNGVIDTTANSTIIKGTGICRCVNPDKFLFTVDSIVYTFNSEGKAANLNSVGMKLLMGEITETLATVGARVTRGTSSYDITSLSARDEFAIQALRGLLRTIEDPASLSDTEKRYYCDVAYQWAANMMQSAAYTRQNAVNPADVSVPDVEGIVGALQAVSTAIGGISISGGSSGGSTDVSGIVNKLEEIDFADNASLKIGGNIAIGNPKDTDNNTIPLKVEIDNTESFPITDWREVAVVTRQYYNSWFKIIYDSSFSNSHIKIECFDEEGNSVNENRAENWHCQWYDSNDDADGNVFISPLTEVMSSLKNRVVGIDGGGYLEIIPYAGADPELTIMCIKVYVKTASSGEISGTVNIGNSGLGMNAQNPFYVSFSGDYLPLTGGTLTGDLRLKDNTNYGMKLLFGDNEYCCLQEDSDDHLKIYASNGITLAGDGIVIDALGTSVNINDDVYLKPGTTIYLKETVNNITRDREVATQKWVDDNYASKNSVITKTNNSTSLLKANGDTIALTNFMQGDRIKELCEMLNRCFEQANVDIVVGYKKPTQDTFALLPAASASGVHRIGTGVTYVTTNTAAAYIGYVEGSFGSGSAGITNPLIIIISGVIKLLGTSADGSSLYYFNQGNIQTTNSDWNMSSFVNSILTSAVTKLSKIGIDVQNGNSTLVLGSGMSTATVSYYIPEFL